MSTPQESQAMHQLQFKQSKLLDKIDELRSIGVGGLVELPQLIVCGSQSIGKSSVLEAISRVRFPAKGNVCTRFATEVVLRRSPQARLKVSIEPGASRTDETECHKLRGFTSETFSSTDDLPQLIDQAKDCMGFGQGGSEDTGFSDDVLKVEISSPENPELTLVDLPGLYTSVSADQGKEGIRIVRQLTERYMENTRSIILGVISAKSDYHLQEVLDIAAKFDPTYERTLGIITHPDRLEPNSEEEDTYLQFVKNEKIKLRLGWHVLRNRSFETREASDDARDEKEKEFFEQGRWASIPRDCVGIESLRHRLSNVLLKHVRRNLPGLITDIQEKINGHEQKLSKLGSPRSSLQEQRGFLIGISSGFERITNHALNGMYTDEFFGGLDLKHNTLNSDEYRYRRLRAIIREMNEEFAEEITLRGSRRVIQDGFSSGPFIGEALTRKFSFGAKAYVPDWAPIFVTRKHLQEEISEQARENRGLELPGSANQLLVGGLFRDQSKPWEKIAKAHLSQVWDSVQYFVCLALKHLTDSDTFSVLMGSIILPELERMKTVLMEKLRELTSYNKSGHPLPIGKSFLLKMQELRQRRELAALKDEMLARKRGGFVTFNLDDLEQAASKLQSSSDQFAAADIIEQMQAYYDTAIVTFIDNIAILAIENCLLRPLERVFNSQVVNSLSDEQIRELASESQHIQQERKRLNQELEKLQTGLRTLSVFNTDGSSLPRPPKLPSRAQARTAELVPEHTGRSSDAQDVHQQPNINTQSNDKTTDTTTQKKEQQRAPSFGDAPSLSHQKGTYLIPNFPNDHVTQIPSFSSVPHRPFSSHFRDSYSAGAGLFGSQSHGPLFGTGSKNYEGPNASHAPSQYPSTKNGFQG